MRKSRRRSDRADFEVHAGFFLQHADNLGQIGRRWIAAGAEHAHQAFRWDSRCLGQRGKADGRIDEVSQYGARRADVALDQGLNGFLEQRLSEFRIGLDFRFDVISEATCENHVRPR